MAFKYYWVNVGGHWIKRYPQGRPTNAQRIQAYYDGIKGARNAQPHLTEEQLAALCDSIRRAWSRETCYPPMADNWTPENPSYGQCAVSALMIQTLAGGEILFNERLNHFWNRIHGIELDITRDQFAVGIDLTPAYPANRSDMLFSEAARQMQTPKRFEVLYDRAYTHELWEILRTDPALSKIVEPAR